MRGSHASGFPHGSHSPIEGLTYDTRYAGGCAAQIPFHHTYEKDNKLLHTGGKELLAGFLMTSTLRKPKSLVRTNRKLARHHILSLSRSIYQGLVTPHGWSPPPPTPYETISSIRHLFWEGAGHGG